MLLTGGIPEYLGPYKAEEVVAKFREIHPDYTPEQVDIAAATAFRAWPGQRMGGGAAGGESEEPGAYVGLSDGLQGSGRAGDAYDRYSVHVRQYCDGAGAGWDGSGAAGGGECAGGDHVADADYVCDDGDPNGAMNKGLLPSGRLMI